MQQDGNYDQENQDGYIIIQKCDKINLIFLSLATVTIQSE